MDDNSRDSVGTNESIKDTGFAFAQISDMEDWYQELKDQKLITDPSKLTVTGYSLGGHLASAFSMLRQEERAAQGLSGNGLKWVYTFNGAGTGYVNSNSYYNLTGLLELFRDIWKNHNDPYPEPSDNQLLWHDAKLRLAYINSEIKRVYGKEGQGGLTNSAGYRPFEAEDNAYTDIWLHYALQVMDISTTGSGLGANLNPTEEKVGAPFFENMTELFGSGLSFVATSGIHHTYDRISIPIEAQPQHRGSYWNHPIYKYFTIYQNWDINTGADTHSLVLVQDSLAIMDLFIQLDPTLKNNLAFFDQLFSALSNSQASVNGKNGTAEGDTLETALDILARLFTGEDPELRKQLIGEEDINSGNTWYNKEHRDLFYDQLAKIKEAIGTSGASALKIVSLLNVNLGNLLDVISNPIYGDNAIAYRYAVVNGIPFVVEGFDYSDFNKNGELDLYDPQTGKGQLTQKFLEYKSAYLDVLNSINTNNFQADGKSKEGKDYLLYHHQSMQHNLKIIDHNAKKEFYNGYAAIDNVAASELVYFGSDQEDTIDISGSKKQYAFGGEGDDTITLGGSGESYAEGGEGNDTYIINTKNFLGINKNIGKNTIFDIDGKGSIKVDGELVSGRFEIDYPAGNITVYAIKGNPKWRLLADAQKPGEFVLERLFNHSYGVAGYETIATLKGWNLSSTSDSPTNRSSQSTNSYLGLTISNEFKPDDIYGYAPWMGYETLPENYFGEGNSHTVWREGGNLSLHHMFGYSGLPVGPIAVVFDDYPSQILGSSYGDQIQLGNGNNIVTAGLGNDFIITGDGNDWISSGISYESAYPDKDYVIAGKGADYIYGGKDDDTIISDGTEDLNQTNSDERGDFVTASDGNDTVYGSNAKDILMGGAGEDTIYGGGGDDLILGDGDYQLRRATLISTDVPFLDFKWNEAGYFEYTLSKGVSLTMIPTTFSWDWTLDGSGGADITYKNSASKTDWLTEGGANDIIHGGAGDDWIAGQTGSDVIYGGEGDDIIYGDDIKPMDEALEGNDIIYGGHGSDTIYGGGGNDSLFAGEINQSHEELNADTVQDTLYGGKGDDILVATGGGDLLYGEEGNDTLIAAHGAKLYGGEGNDILVASKANNAELNGDEGDDTFYAGEGNNVTLNGGSGNDTFHLSTGKNTYINAGSGTNRYFITKETYSQGGETVIANDSGLWELRNHAL